MTKSSDAFRTISEVADDLGVPKHVLRFWEVKFTQIKPMKRGGGRRYYRPADLELLRGIRHLLHREGYTIKGVQKILREQGVDVVKNFADGGEQVAPTASDRAPLPASSEPAPRARRMPKGAGKASANAQPATAQQTAPSERDRKRIIRQAIAELEIARALLKGAAPGAGETQLRRSQAS